MVQMGLVTALCGCTIHQVDGISHLYSVLANRPPESSDEGHVSTAL
jgi:hypothetical protein